MKFLNVECPVIITKFSKHERIKDKLLDLIASAKFESVEPIEGNSRIKELELERGPQDSVARVDWVYAKDFERPWVKFLWNHFIDNYIPIIKKLGYASAEIRDMWFQQYLKNGKHGWHSHGHNYTGVYYLEFPDGAPATEFQTMETRISQENMITQIPNIKEGDFITFPAFLLHRAPKVLNVERKTIISFNIDFI